jgi:hypothetical protein
MPTFVDDYSPAKRSQALTSLLGIEKDQAAHPYGYCLDLIYSKYDKVILPYNVDRGFVVLELVLKSIQGRYIKVWDGNQLWMGGDPRRRGEITTLIDVFYGGDSRVPVYVWREGDPKYEHKYGAGAFAFMTMCHRALEAEPMGWTDVDECIARNYAWACILDGAILDFPKLKLL